MRQKIVQVVAARPNFIKMAPIIEAFEDEPDIEQVVVHTGQHYDISMSDAILADLRCAAPAIYLDVRSGTHGEQTGRTLIRFERLLLSERPALVVVAGDVNATLACALAASKLQIPVAHVESGLRSHDWSMPEEINRILTDRMSTLLFTHSPEAATNLAEEGINPDIIHYVGNTMIDSLTKAHSAALERSAWEKFGVDPYSYVLVTLHRPSNVDEPARLSRIVEALAELAASVPIIFPIHPRTRRFLELTGLMTRLRSSRVHCCAPQGYIDFLSLEASAGAVLTDSGGVQEETTALGVRCYTLRSNTERPVTVTLGTNELIGTEADAILGVRPTLRPPVQCGVPLWDGLAAGRLARVVSRFLSQSTRREVAWSA